MKRTIILTLGVSIVGIAAYLAGVSNQNGSTFLVDAFSQTKAPATSSLVPNEPGEACVYGGELFSENSVVCYGAASTAMVCQNDKWTLVPAKSEAETCGFKTIHISPLS